AMDAYLDRPPGGVNLRQRLPPGARIRLTSITYRSYVSGVHPAGGRPMLARLGRFTVRHRKGILVAAVLFVVGSFAIAGNVTDRLTSGGFYDPHSESEQAAAILQHDF